MATLLHRIHVEPQQSLKSWNVEFDCENGKLSSPSWRCSFANRNTKLHSIISHSAINHPTIHHFTAGEHTVALAKDIVWCLYNVFVCCSTTLQCLLLDWSSNESSKKRWKSPPYTNDMKSWHRPMLQAWLSHTTLPNAYKLPEWHQQIWHTRLRSWRSITNSSPTTYIDPLFLWYLQVSSVKAEPGIRSFVRSKKNWFGNFNSSQKWYST
jgi:hypothetical protein